jgi:hypothetical protein
VHTNLYSRKENRREETIAKRRRKWENIIEMDLTVVGCEAVNWIRCLCPVKMIMNFQVPLEAESFLTM